MAEEIQEEVQEQPKKGSNIKMLIIIISAALVLGGGGFLSFMLMKGGEPREEATEAHEEVAEDHGEAHEGEKGNKNTLIAFQPFVVNLSVPGRYLKVTMQFEVNDRKDKGLVEEKSPVIRDTVITLLSSKSAEAVSGPEGKFQLKDELLYRANQAMGKEVFKNIYFTEFVMQ